MEYISCLEPKVADKILLYAYGEYPDNLGDWKAKLALLGICKGWRNRIYPKLYNKVIVEYASNTPASTRQIAKWSTNLELIALSTEYCDVDKLSISARGAFNGIQLLKQLEIMLNHAKFKWESTSSIRVNVELPRYRLDAASKIAFSNHLKKIGQLIINKMPNINAITVLEDFGFTYLIDLSSMLIKAYKYQLQFIAIFPTPDIDVPYFGSNLKYLRLRFKSALDAIPLPVVHVPPLYELVMNNLHSEFSWRPFCDMLTPNNVHFKNLVILRLDYADSGVSKSPGGNQTLTYSTDHVMLHFPALREIRILNCPPESSILNATFNINPLQKVVMDGNIDNMKEYFYLKLRSRMLIIQPYCYSDSQIPTYVDALNKLLGFASNYAWIKLNLFVPLTDININTLTWAYLKCLKLKRQARVYDILNLVLHLPQLDSLIVEHLIPQLCSDTLNLLQTIYTQQTTGIRHDINIKQLGVQRDIIYSDDATINACLSLATCMDMLEQLRVPKGCENDFKQRITELIKQFPHFSNIQVL